MSSDNLYMQERQQRVVERLRELGRVSVKELSQELGVSEVTIRQDLRTLEKQGLLERTHGGAVLPRGTTSAPKLSFELRNLVNHEEKDRIAQAAAARVKNGDSIALDASTTVYRMLPYLKQFSRLVIVTNSLMVAQSLLDAPQIEVFMPGGKLRPDSISMVGKPEQLPDVNLNMGFFGSHGVSVSAGLTESNREEAQLKQVLMGHCIQSVFLIDHTKWAKVAPYTITDEFERCTIYTSTNAPDNAVNEVETRGAKIVRI